MPWPGIGAQPTHDETDTGRAGPRCGELTSLHGLAGGSKRPRKSGHLSETNRFGHDGRQLASAQVRRPRLDNEFEKCDRDPRVRWIVSQPFRLSWGGPAPGRHTPDLLRLSADDAVTVWDARRLDEQHETFGVQAEVTRQCCARWLINPPEPWRRFQ